MRGHAPRQPKLFYQINVESLTPAEHPLREVLRRVDLAMWQLSPRFSTMFSHTGRPSVPPEQMLKAQLLRVLYSIPSDIQLCDRLTTDLRLRWFVGLSPDDPVWTPEAFSMNRDRYERAGIHAGLFAAILEQAIAEGLVNHEHFSVDGTLLKAYGSMKSFRPKDDGEDGEGGGTGADFHGERRSNATHASTTDPLARLAHKNGTSQLSHTLNIMIENNHGLVVASDLRQPSGRAEHDAVVPMLDAAATAGLSPAAVGADKGYDSGPLMLELERRDVTPMIAVKREPSPRKTPERQTVEAEARRRCRQRADAVKSKVSAAGSLYRFMQRFRKRVEEVFGWAKDVGPLRKLKWPRQRPGVRRGRGSWSGAPPPDVVRQFADLTLTGWNLVRLATITRQMRTAA